MIAKSPKEAPLDVDASAIQEAYREAAQSKDFEEIERLNELVHKRSRPALPKAKD